MSDNEKHLTHYLILLLGLVVFIYLFVLFKYETRWQLVIAAFASGFYALWGIIHHAVEKRLDKWIALEYLLIAGFVFLVVYTALSL
ncbi:MAG TPA: hypothetical protein VLI92_01420 [Candidatus Saccharimonadales bacterium]|nr:hypothetical protein [Candidatus Saccharimonadales bacterium]